MGGGSDADFQAPPSSRSQSASRERQLVTSSLPLVGGWGGDNSRALTNEAVPGALGSQVGERTVEHPQERVCKRVCAEL